MPPGPGRARAGRGAARQRVVLPALHRPRGLRAAVLAVRLRDDEPVLAGINCIFLRRHLLANIRILLDFGNPDVRIKNFHVSSERLQHRLRQRRGARPPRRADPADDVADVRLHRAGRRLVRPRPGQVHLRTGVYVLSGVIPRVTRIDVGITNSITRVTDLRTLVFI